MRGSPRRRQRFRPGCRLRTGTFSIRPHSGLNSGAMGSISKTGIRWSTRAPRWPRSSRSIPRKSKASSRQHDGPRSTCFGRHRYGAGRPDRDADLFHFVGSSRADHAAGKWRDGPREAECGRRGASGWGNTVSWTDSILSTVVGPFYSARTGQVDPWTLNILKADQAAERVTALGPNATDAEKAVAAAQAASQGDADLVRLGAHAEQPRGRRLPGLGGS